jgi:hypothetical protein
MSLQNKNGNKAEKEFAEYMHGKKYWVHIMARDGRGNQPFDAIAIKNNMPWMVDVKNVESGEVFALNRVEPNQIGAFKVLMATGNTNCGFAIRFGLSGFYFLMFVDYLKLIEEGRTVVTKKELLPITMHVS